MSASDLLPQLLAWWQVKSIRDKWVLGTAVCALGAVAWWSLVWSPLQGAKDAAHSRIARLETARAILARLPADTRLPQQDDGEQAGLRDTVSATASALKLPVQRIEQSSGQVVVSFDAADFGQIMLWLDTLSRDHAITVIKASVVRRTAPGMVSAEMTLERI